MNSNHSTQGENHDQGNIGTRTFGLRARGSGLSDRLTVSVDAPTKELGQGEIIPALTPERKINNAEVVEAYDENLPALFSGSDDFGGKLDELPISDDQENVSNSGPDSFSVANCSGIETGNVGEKQNDPGRNGKSNKGNSGRIERRKDGIYGSMDNYDSPNFHLSAEVEIAQSARINSPALQAGFDAGKTPVLNDQKTPVLNPVESKAEKEDTAKKEKADSVAIEPLKSSKHGWLIRVRLHSEPGKPAIPISYMSDADYKTLRRSKKRYEEFKRNIKKQYQKTTRQGNNAGSDSDCS